MPTFTTRSAGDTLLWHHIAFRITRTYVMHGIGSGGTPSPTTGQIWPRFTV